MRFDFIILPLKCSFKALQIIINDSKWIKDLRAPTVSCINIPILISCNGSFSVNKLLSHAEKSLFLTDIYAPHM